jgi:dsDNA-specific endonuclease/ATPase MutS2
MFNALLFGALHFSDANSYYRKLENQYAELHDDREKVKKKLRAALSKVEKRTQESEALVCQLLPPFPSYFSNAVASPMFQEGQSEEVQNKLSNLKKNEKTRLNNIKNAEAQIVALKEELETEVGIQSPRMTSIPDGSSVG